MEPRIDYAKMAPEVRAAMMGLEQYVHQTGLDRGLLELVKLRGRSSTGARIVRTCTPRSRARGVRRSSASTR